MDTQTNRSLELCTRKVTTESFVEEAKAIYGDRYDYSKVAYINRDHMVTVTCPIHGDFQVYAREHLDGKGCPKCEKSEKFLAKLHEKFGEKFGLDEFKYESSTDPVTLICPIHGAFSRKPHQLLSSPFGCPQCGNEHLRKLREIAHQDAIDHKEERDLARKERERDRARAKKLAEEQAAKEKWGLRIQNILDSRKQEEDIFGPSPDDYWYEDFFGFNLKNFYLDDGSIIDGMYHSCIPITYYPFCDLKVEANQGDLVQATLYTSSLEDNVLYELFLVIENILSHGFYNSFEQIKNKYSEIIEEDFTVDGVRDGYKILLTKKWDNVKVNIKRIGAKAQRIQNFKKIDARLLPKSFVGIDFETLYPQRVSACSVGMVKYVNGEIMDRYYTLIRPPFEYPGKRGVPLTWIHGITEDMVRGEKTFNEVLPEMERFVDGLPLVAHNACVEKACIRDASAFYGVETQLDFENIFDTLALSRQAEAKLGIIADGPGSHQLDIVCRRFAISGDNHHNALSDAEMCGNLMVLFQKILKEDTCTESVIDNTPASPTEKPAEKVPVFDMDDIEENPFKNKVVVLTGFSQFDKQVYELKLSELGAIIKSSVSAKTNILITGYNAGPAKLQKANEVGASIMSEAEMNEIINQIKGI